MPNFAAPTIRSQPTPSSGGSGGSAGGNTNNPAPAVSAAVASAVQPQPQTVPVTPDTNLIVNPPANETVKPSQTLYTITLQPLENRILTCEGNQFYIVTLNSGLGGTVSIRTKGSPFNEYEERTGRRLSTQFFTAIEIINDELNLPITLTIAIGNDVFLDHRIT